VLALLAHDADKRVYLRVERRTRGYRAADLATAPRASHAPPDDVGGPPGYEEFLVAIKDPEHEEHDSMLVWIAGAFDPEGFDLNAINRTLRFGPP
jgi:pRiA4b ORF-3-like protein